MFAQILGWLSIISSSVRRVRVRRSLLFVETLEARVVPNNTPYYVDSANGQDTNDGHNAPWRTVARVMRQLDGTPQPYQDGDSILFHGGESFNIGAGLDLWGSQLGGHITIDSYLYGGLIPPAILNTTDTVATDAVGIDIHSAGNVTIRHLTLTGPWTTSTPDPTKVYTGGGILFENADTSHSNYSNIVVDSVTVSNYASVGIAIFNDADAAHQNTYTGISITGANIFNNFGSGIIISDLGMGSILPTTRDIFNVDVEYCYVHGDYHDTAYREGYGTYFENVSGADLDDCTYEGNDYTTNNPAGGFGSGVAYQSDKVFMWGNVSVSNTQVTTGHQPVDGGSFDLDAGVWGSVMEGNYSGNNPGEGYLLSGNQTPGPGQQGNIIRFNVSQNDSRINNYGAITLSIGNIHGAQIYNNTVYMTSPASGFGPGAAFSVQDGAVPYNVIVSNNIFFVSGSPLILHLNCPGVNITAANNISFQGNDYYNGNTQPNQLVIYWNTGSLGSQYQLVSGWQHANSDQEAGLVLHDGDPALSNPGGGDTDTNGGTRSVNVLLSDGFSAYALMSSSPLIRGGQDLSSLTWDPFTQNSFVESYFVASGYSTGPQDYFHTAAPSGPWDVGAVFVH
jgi:hypothetical protein